MNAFETILSRRSIRHYTSQSIADETIQKLLTAAMHAPSAGNQQPWHFIIIKDQSMMKKITSIHPHSAMLHHAQAAILICGDETLEKYKGFWVQDCAAASQNILLTAHELGLGSVWVGIHPDVERVAAFRELFHIPKHVIPLSLLPLGYPNEAKSKENRFKTDRVHHEKW